MVPALALAFLVSASESPPPTAEASIPFETYMLENGLHVILSEDHSVPFVQVNLWYGVGSKDEVEGRTGFAHLFEHLMFQGSAHHDDEYFGPLMPIGARVNGTTNTDRTNFFEGVPSSYLPLALWLESDRLGWLLPALTDEKIQNQKDVVRNERRQNYDNRPYGQVPMWLREALYPEGHPYRVPTIGLHEDIEAATSEDVKAFFQKWYTPNNAWLAIVGDIDPAQTRARRPLLGASRAVRCAPDPRGQGFAQRREDRPKPSRVPLDKARSRLTPPIYADGDAALDVASAILADGKDSPLYKRLVHDTKVATDVTAYQASARLDSNFTIEATAAPGHDTDEVVAEVDKVLAEFLEAPPTAEQVTVARLRIERTFFEGLQSIATKANQLNGYAYVTGDPGYIGKDLARYRALTPASVGAAAKTWIGNKNRVVLHVFPEAQAGGAK
jgi:zinc protease